MIEVADIFKEYGESYRNKYNLPLQHLKVMSAIEDCRTANIMRNKFKEEKDESYTKVWNGI